MPDYLGEDQRAVKEDKKGKDEEKIVEVLTEADIALFKKYGTGYYYDAIKGVEDDITRLMKTVNDLSGVKESDTGLAPTALWDLAADKQTLHAEQPLQVPFFFRVLNVSEISWAWKIVG